jgi:hypothetical protein
LVAETMAKLPHCDELFLKYFDPWYDSDDRERRGWKATRPDMEHRWRDGTPLDAVQPLSQEGRVAVAKQLGVMHDAAANDWPTYLDVTGPISLEWIGAFDRYYDRPAIQRLIDRSDPTDQSNDYVIIAIEFGAVMGKLLLDRLPGSGWLCEWPYWESAVYVPARGTRINVFTWAVKKLSEYGWDDGFVAKINAVPAVLETKVASGEKGSINAPLFLYPDTGDGPPGDEGDFEVDD